jgi:uncharacterized membrane protein YgcG
MKQAIADGFRSLWTWAATSWHAWVADERGAATVIVALTMTGLIGLVALGVDLGALFNARSEAQRAADAAALAGASAFLDFQNETARSVAVERATTFATKNDIRGRAIAPEDVSIAVNLDSSTVRAVVRREGVPTWFARIFGIDAVNVSAEATAWAGMAGAAQCLKPFAVPDVWEESSDDVNGNRIQDPGEHWSYDPDAGDRYAPYSGPGGAPDETGYGSSWRDGRSDASGRTYARDYGRRVTVKVTNPRDAWTPSIFLPWVLPEDRDQATCSAGAPRGGGGGGGDGGAGGGGDGSGGGEGGGEGSGGGKGTGWFKWMDRRGGLGGGVPGGGSDGPGGSGGGEGGDGGAVDRDSGRGRGAARYRQNICSCNASIIDLDTEYMIEPGNMVGPTYQGVQKLIDMDPDAYWDDRSNTLVSKHGMASPRVVTVAVFNPGELSKPGRQYVRFNNFVRVFIEAQESPKDPVTGRMLYYVPGLGSTRDGATKGSLVRVLQLIR